MTETLIRRVDLGNGMVLEFLDRSNRYYGDYHRILIDIEAIVGTAGGTMRLRYQRPLKKMGVSSACVKSGTEDLIDQFLASTSQYMRHADFVVRVLESTQRPGQRLWKPLD
jgi:hypothetical protein